MERYIVANWKMNPGSLKDAEALFKKLVARNSRTKRTRIVLCPPTLFVGSIGAGYRGKRVLLGSQDVSAFPKTGSHTGEVSASMLSSVGVTYSVVGHSERRALGETGAQVSEKIRESLAVGITPIVCIGERERDAEGQHLHFLKEQIQSSLVGIPKNRLSKILVAYEPLWAIGKSSDDAITPHKLAESSIFIRKTLCVLYGRNVGMKIPILYGGSVEPDNAEELITEGHVAGFLVGHASLTVEDFTAIVRTVDSTRV